MSTIELLTFSMRKEAPKAGADWFRIVVDKKNDVAKVYIYDEIGYWGTTAKDFAALLDEIEESTIHLHINSPGGSVFDGLAIGASIQNHDAEVIGKVDGMAASAASFILQYCDKREISRNAQVMIHDASAYAGGNAAAMRRAADLLDRVSDNIADIYAVKSGQGDAKSWRKIMVAGDKWYDGNEALAAGLVDVVTDNPDEEEAEDAAKMSPVSWTKEEIEAFVTTPAATLAKDSNRSVIANQVPEETMTGNAPQNPTPPAVQQPPATDPQAQQQAPAAPVAPSPAAGPAPSPAPAAGLVAVVINGAQHMVPQAVADQMNGLQTFKNETVETHRKDFVAGLASKNVIAATKIEDTEKFALGLTDEQFSQWKASMEGAHPQTLFATHGTNPGNEQAPSNGGTTADTIKDEIAVLEGVVSAHRDAGMSDEVVKGKASYKRLTELKDQLAKLG